MKNSYVIMLSLLIFIIALTIGVFMGKGLVKEDPNDTYNTGWADCQKRFTESGVYKENSDIVVKSLSGKITKKMENSFVLKLSAIDPFLDKTFDERKIKLSDGVKIYRSLKKSDEEYEKEMNAVVASGKELRPDSPDGLPLRFSKVEIKFSDLAVDDKVVVKSEGDVRKAKELNAYEVIVSSPE